MEMCELLENVSKQISSRRQEIGLNQNQFSIAIGTSHRVAARWEEQRGLPSAYFLCKMAELFGCSIDALLGREG